MAFLDVALLLTGVLLLLGIALSKFSTRLGMPVLILFLGVGMLAARSDARLPRWKHGTLTCSPDREPAAEQEISAASVVTATPGASRPPGVSSSQGASPERDAGP